MLLRSLYALDEYRISRNLDNVLITIVNHNIIYYLFRIYVTLMKIER